MNIIGLIEMHPFDGAEAFMCLRVVNASGSLFDLPINEEQLTIIMNNMPSDNKGTEEAHNTTSNNQEVTNIENYQRSPTRPEQEDALVLDTSHYSMGQAMGWAEDDDL